MTIFALRLSRFSDFIAVCLGRWKRHVRGAALENLSDRSLKDIGIEPYLVTSSLMAVLAQRLLRRTCQACGGGKIIAVDASGQPTGRCEV